MPHTRWPRLRQVYERIAALPIEQARAAAEHELADDPDLARELIAMLDWKLERAYLRSLDDGGGEPASFPAHQRLGEYELLFELGGGPLGMVYLARHLSLDRPVALKVLGSRWSNQPKHVERFRREAQRLTRFRHPGVAQVFEVQSIDRVHFLAMEFVDGLGLHHELACQQRRIDPAICRAGLPAADSKGYFRAVAGVVRQAAQALADAHGQQITHRDLKPQNLILGRDGRMRIVDFGLARDAGGGLAPAGDEFGATPHYLSPEQLRPTRDRSVDPRSDIYSLGAILYELLTLTRPFEATTTRELLKAIQFQEVTPVRVRNRRVPRDLALICQTAMQKLPHERYASAGEFAADLGRFLNGEAILAAPPSGANRAHHFVRRHRRALVAALLVAAAVPVGLLLRDRYYFDPKLTQVSFDYSGPLGELEPRHLSYRVFDPLSERFFKPVDLGNWPLAEQPLPTGFLRLRVEYSDGQFAELGRYLRPGVRKASLQLASRKLARSDVTGMALVHAGVLSRRNERPGVYCSNVDQDIPVAAFYLDVCEVSVAEYRRFLRETARPAPQTWGLFGEDEQFDRRPVSGISRRDMQAYAEYQGKRLPTHAEWEWAARGSSERLTPTGAEWNADLRAAIHGEGPRNSQSREERVELWKRFTRDVGSSPDDRTPDGICDLLGNVREATEGAYVDIHAGAGRPQVMPDIYWVLGNAWYSDRPAMALDAHAMNGINTPGSAEDGFRCARSVVP